MKLRKFGDVKAIRESINKSVTDAFNNLPPVEGKFIKYRFKNVSIPNVTYNKAEGKDAKIYDRDLTVPVKGEIELLDKKTDRVLGKRKMTIGQLPYLTDKLGTFIGNGTDFSVANQMRLLPGVYVREKVDGNIEAQYNTQGNIGFRVNMDPASAQFTINVGNNKLPIYPILKGVGITDEQMKEAWGNDIYDKNYTHKKEPLERFYKKVAGYNALNELSPEEQGDHLRRHFKDLKLDPSVTKRTLGKPYDSVDPENLLVSTKKILNTFSGKEKPDDRDSLVFKSFFGVEDFMRERVEKDSGRLAKRLAYKLDTTKDLEKVPSGYFSPYLKNIMKGDDRAFPLEEINPIQLYDNLHRNMVLGEGGIGSTDMVTAEARNVHPSQFFFIDPVRGPESDKIGIDTRTTHLTYKGDDKKIYARFINAKTGKEEYLSPDQIYDKIVAFPGEIRKSNDVRCMEKGQITTKRRRHIDYYVPDLSEMLSTYSNMVPMVSAIQGNRLLMAGKALSETLPLKDKEAPIVRSRVEDTDEDFETRYGKRTLSEVSPVNGEVIKVSKDAITIKDKEGKKHVVDLFVDYPMSRKTQINQTSTVSVGDKVKSGDVVAESNFTDKNGTLSVGKHLRTAFLPFRGLTFEDGVAISESAAKKLTSEQMYQFEVPLDEDTFVDKRMYTGYFPSIYNKTQADKIDAQGIPKKGAILSKHDPIIMAMKSKTLTPTDLTLGKLHKNLKNKYEDVSPEWEHEEDGEVIDSIVTKKKAKVFVRTYTPLKVGDKLTGRYGNKGVISAIIPDNEMPVIDRTGEPLEIILNNNGITSRINPAQIWEGILGKIGKEKGKIYRMPGYTPEKYSDIVEKEMKKEGIPASEFLTDPKEGKLRTMVTYPYFYKLSMMAESKLGGREISSYTSNLQPVKGQVDGGTAGIVYSSSLMPLKSQKAEGGAVRIGADLLPALLAHGARYNMKDFGIKGQKNDEFWKAYRLGYPLPSPEAPFVYKKFEAMLRAAGANVNKSGDIISIKPMTDADIMKTSSGELQNAKFLSARTMEPEKGGLFDFALTGGPSGEKWSHINLNEPMPNPMMEDSIRSLLGLNTKEYDKVISGEMPLNGKFGGEAIKDALSNINVDREIDHLKETIPAEKKSNKDKLVKKLKFLYGLKTAEKKPEDLVMTKFPIIPPIFRPISMLGEKGTVTVSDANKLYRDLFYANDVIRDLKNSGFSNDQLNDERKNLYESIRATSGIGDPVSIKNQQSDTKGFIKKITGNQPKTGFFFEKLISKTQDLSGRGVAYLDPTLSMDELTIPEKIAWKVNKPHVIRELVKKRGLPAVTANELVEQRHSLAKDALNTVMENVPILMNRAPSLHKFSIMAFKQKLNKTNAIGTPPHISGPYALDYDGDALQLFVPVTEKAIQEAKEKLLPSKNLFSIKDYSVHYTPPHEDILGLYLASTENKKNKPIKFDTIEEMEKALRENKISYDTVVEIANAS